MTALALRLSERAMPDAWLENSDTAVAPAFIDYVRPLVEPLIEYAVPLKDQAFGKDAE